jgi:hypothetical protein
MLSTLDKEQYWRTVEASLVEILGMDAAEAYQKVLELRLNIAKGFQGESLDIAYHNEPLKVAVDLAGYELGQFDFLAHKDQYASIRERYIPIGGNQKLESVDEYFQFARELESVAKIELGENMVSLAVEELAIRMVMAGRLLRNESLALITEEKKK